MLDTKITYSYTISDQSDHEKCLLKYTRGFQRYKEALSVSIHRTSAGVFKQKKINTGNGYKRGRRAKEQRAEGVHYYINCESPLFVEEKKENVVPQNPCTAEAAVANTKAIAPNILQEGCTPTALPVFAYIDSNFVS